MDMDFSAILNDFDWNGLFATAGKIGGALLILLIGWLLARIVSRTVARLLKKAGVEKLADKINETKAIQDLKIKIDPIRIIKTFLYWILMLFTVMTAADSAGLDQVTTLITDLINFLPSVIKAFAIMIGGLILADAVRNVVGTACRSLGIPSWKVIGSLVFGLIGIMVAITALEQINVPTEIITSNITIILGGIMLAFGIAYGFAARDVLSSILAGFYSRNNFKVGQIIEVNGHQGMITKIDTVSLTMEADGRSIVMPLHRLVQEDVFIHQDVAPPAEVQPGSAHED